MTPAGRFAVATGVLMTAVVGGVALLSRSSGRLRGSKLQRGEIGGFTVQRMGPGGRMVYARGNDKATQATDYDRAQLRHVLNAIDTDAIRVYEDGEPVARAVWDRIRDPDFQLDPDEAAEPSTPRRAGPARRRRR